MSELNIRVWNANIGRSSNGEIETMKKHLKFLFLCLMVLLISATTGLAASNPNIVVIYADDLGYGDVQCYNPERGKILTPHIDQIRAVQKPRAPSTRRMCTSN